MIDGQARTSAACEKEARVDDFLTSRAYLVYSYSHLKKLHNRNAASEKIKITLIVFHEC